MPEAEKKEELSEEVSIHWRLRWLTKSNKIPTFFHLFFPLEDFPSFCHNEGISLFTEAEHRDSSSSCCNHRLQSLCRTTENKKTGCRWHGTSVTKWIQSSQRHCKLIDWLIPVDKLAKLSGDFHNCLKMSLNVSNKSQQTISKTTKLVLFLLIKLTGAGLPEMWTDVDNFLDINIQNPYCLLFTAQNEWQGTFGLDWIS